MNKQNLKLGESYNRYMQMYVYARHHVDVMYNAIYIYFNHNTSSLYHTYIYLHGYHIKCVGTRNRQLFASASGSLTWESAGERERYIWYQCTCTICICMHASMTLRHRDGCVLMWTDRFLSPILCHCSWSLMLRAYKFVREKVVVGV